MATETIVALIGATVVLGLTGLAAWIRWSIRTAITSVVNGSLKQVSESLTDLKNWTEAHDRRHSFEQRQLISALSRQGIVPPDGWDVPTDLQIAREG